MLGFQHVPAAQSISEGVWPKYAASVALRRIVWAVLYGDVCGDFPSDFVVQPQRFVMEAAKYEASDQAHRRFKDDNFSLWTEHSRALSEGGPRKLEVVPDVKQNQVAYRPSFEAQIVRILHVIQPWIRENVRRNAVRDVF